jgi:hypothetical protein
MVKYRCILWLNGLCLLIVVALLVYTELLNPSAGALFIYATSESRFSN